MEIVDANNFVDCKFKVDCELNTFPLKKEGGDPTKYSRAQSITTTQTRRLEHEPILCRKRSHSSKIICIQEDQKMHKCIGCGEISTDLKAHIEEKHKDVGNDVIVHAMKSQCDWCGLKNSELKYFNFSFSDVKYVKSCQQSLNLAIDLKKPSSHEVIMMDLVNTLMYHIDAYKAPLLIKPPVQQNLNKPPLFWTKSPLFEAF